MSGPLSNPYMFKSAAGATNFYEHQIANSARFTGSGVLSRTAGTPTNVDKFTISCWVKRSKLATANNFVFGYTDNINYQKLAFNSTDKLELHEQRGAGDSNGLRTVDQVFRDASAWYNVVWVFDSGNATEADREIFYVNGTRLSDVEGWDGGYPTQNRDSVFNKSGATIHIGSASSYYGSYFQGYMAEVVFNDGQAYAASNYGETKNGVWVPKDVSGLTFGNNGFHLNFASSSDMGNDVSGNNNDFSATNISAHDQMLDSPTNNFCTINPIYRGEQTSDAKYGVLSKGNLQHEFSGSTDGQCPCTHKTPASGKWYFEYVITGGGGSSSYSPAAGIIDPNTYTMNGGNYNDTGSIQYLNNTNTVRKSGSETGAYSGSRGSNNDVMGIAVDMDNGAFYVSKNGTFQTISGGSQGDPTSGASRTGAGATWTPASEFTSGMVPLSAPTGGSQPIIIMNFGQEGTFANIKTAGGNSDGNGHGNFFSAVPSGYLAICTANLSVVDEIDPAQTDDNYPQKLFSPLLYTGNGGTNNITGLGFQPDLVWIKIRNTASNGPLVDSNRGTNKILFSQITDAEVTSANLTAFGSDGFSLAGGLASYDPNFNGNTNTYCSWNWRANGGTTSTNSAGSHNVTQQVDPSGGFSISTMADTGGAVTIGHGLSKAPSMYIVRGRSGSTSWGVYHEGIGATKYILLETHSAAATGSQYFNDTAPTSTVLSLGATWNGAGTLVVYAFANIEGYCKAGSYAANGNANGSFVYTGFRPAYVMIKGHDVGAEWTVYDDKRDTHNESDHILQMDIHDAERTDLDEIDILSNGFKCRDNGGRTNQSGKNYVYLAMAKNPFKYATAR